MEQWKQHPRAPRARVMRHSRRRACVCVRRYIRDIIGIQGIRIAAQSRRDVLR